MRPYDSGDEPESFDETWGYTLITNGDNEIIGGEWDDENEHPIPARFPPQPTYKVMARLRKPSPRLR